MKLYEHLQDTATLDIAERPALVVQGGGMRGVYSMGALATLEAAGLSDSFSFVIGSSAGACNGAKFLCNQALDGVSIYTDELSCSNFVSLRRPKKIVDIDFFVNTALKERHPLDLQKLQECATPLLTVLTDAESGDERIVSSHDVTHDPYEVIRATSALPGFYDKHVQLGDRHYLDGGIVSQVPVAEAFQQGARELLVVLTRGKGYRLKHQTKGYKVSSRLVAHGQSANVRKLLTAPDSLLNRTFDLLDNEYQEKKRRTWTVRPSDMRRLVGRTTINAAALRDCAEMGKHDMEMLLVQPYTAVK